MCLLHIDYAPGPVPTAAAAAKPGKPAGSPACGPLGLCATWKPLRKPCPFPSSFFFKKNKVWVYLWFTFVILNVKPLGGFLVGFMCPCFYFQFIMNSVFGKCLLYFVHLLFFAITTVTVMLSWYKLYFIIIFLSRSATLASAFWKIHCLSPSLFKVMLLHFSAPSREKCWTSWQF